MNQDQITALVQKTINDVVSSPATQAMVEKASTSAAKKALEAQMIAFGIDASKPLEVQSDFQFLRYTRVTVQSGFGKGMIAGVGLVFTSIGSAVGYLIHYLTTKG
jgi:hypothetical protein